MKLRKYPEYIDTGLDWLGHIPSNWQLKRLGAVFKERREKVSDTDHPALSVTKFGIVPQLENAAKTDAGDNRKRVVVGDFVINSRSDRKGSSGLSTLDGSVSLISTVLQPIGINGLYAHYLLRSQPFQEEFYRFGKGIVADLWSTNYSEMKNISLPMPDGFEQRQIAIFLDRETAKIDRLIEKQQRLIELLKEKRQSVISHAVTKGLNPDAPMKDSSVEWLGEVPAHWLQSRVGWSSVYISYGFTNPMPTSDDGPFMLTANDIDYGRIKYESARKTDIGSYNELLTRKSKPKLGDLLITKDGTLGRVCVHDGKKVCINQSVALLRMDKNKLLPSFLMYVFMGSTYQKRITYEAGGSTIKHIYISRLSHMPVFYPCLVDQQEIINFLESKLSMLDKLINRANDSINLMFERRTALISAAVTGKIDVREQVPQDAEEAVAS